MTETKYVALIAAGGTIAMGARHTFDWIDYGDSGIVRDAAELVKDLGELLSDVEIIPISFRALGSIAIGWADWCDLLEVARSTAQTYPQLSGIVVTHGTATLEETAYFLDLTWDQAVPLIVVGAQRPIGTHGSDAIPNVRAAVAVASTSAPAKRYGAVSVVMNGEVHAPRDVTKSANFLVDAFTSSAGPIARIDAAGTVKSLRPAGTERDWVLRPVAAAPRVDIVASYADADRVAIDAFLAAGAAGIVAQALPPGRVASGQQAALREAAAAGVQVAVASRAQRDSLFLQDHHRRDGFLVAADLPAQKARILLKLALGEGRSRDDIQTMFLSQ